MWCRTHAVVPMSWTTSSSLAQRAISGRCPIGWKSSDCLTPETIRPRCQHGMGWRGSSPAHRTLFCPGLGPLVSWLTPRDAMRRLAVSPSHKAAIKLPGSTGDRGCHAKGPSNRCGRQVAVAAPSATKRFRQKTGPHPPQTSARRHRSQRERPTAGHGPARHGADRRTRRWCHSQGICSLRLSLKGMVTTRADHRLSNTPPASA